MLVSKRFLIVLYILIVLALSGMAKAAVLSDAQLEATTGILSISGILSDTCETNPQIELVANANRQLLLAVKSSRHAGGCMDLIGGKFEIDFDLKGLSLEAGQTYQVSIEGFQGVSLYTAMPSDEKIAAYKADRRELEGYLQLTSNPSTAALDEPLVDSKRQVTKALVPAIITY